MTGWLPLSPENRKYLDPALVIMALVLAWFGQEQFLARQLQSGLWLWALAALLAGVAFWRQPDRAPSAFELKPKWEALALGLIVLLALSVRWWRVDVHPNGYFFDEAVNALIGLQILEDPKYLPMFGPYEAPMPMLYQYLNALAIQLGGVSAYATKFVPMLLGTVTVAMFYFLARRIFSVPLALAATVLLALLRWHINFSRVNFVGIATPLFATAAVYFLLRGLETKNRWHMAFSGMAVSLGLYTYYASNLVPFILGPYLVMQLAWDRKFFKEQWAGLLVFLAASLAVFAPLGYFALTHPDRFFMRNNQVLIFNHAPPDQALAALWTNVKTTLLMFNYFGDTNGRHNIPEVPMLTPLAGIFFGLGLVYAITHLRRRHVFLTLLWFVVALVPGFLTIEAPQGYRCIGAIIPVTLLTVFGLERLWHLTRELARPVGWQRWLPMGMLGVLVLLIGARNLTDYFGRQAKNMICWSEFSSGEAAMGTWLHDLGPTYHAYISARSFNYPTIRFLGKPHLDYEPLNLASAMPSNYPGNKNISFILRPIHDGALSVLKYYYPNGRAQLHYSPYEYVLFGSFEAEREALLAGRGLRGEYCDAVGRKVSAPMGSQGFSFDPGQHGLQAPVDATWTGSLRVQKWGYYQFRLEGAEWFRIAINGLRVRPKGVELAQGNHALRIQARIPAGRGPAGLYWKLASPGSQKREVGWCWSKDGFKLGNVGNRAEKWNAWKPVPGHALSPRDRVYGLYGTYYRSLEWEGEPIFRRVDPLISLIGHDFVTASPFSIRWQGTLEVPRDGHYTFGTLSNEQSWVWINGRQVVANEKPDQYASGRIQLTAGRHPIRIDYRSQTSEYPRIVLYWTPPGRAKEKVPFQALIPATRAPGRQAPRTRP